MKWRFFQLYLILKVLGEIPEQVLSSIQVLIYCFSLLTSKLQEHQRRLKMLHRGTFWVKFHIQFSPGYTKSSLTFSFPQPLSCCHLQHLGVSISHSAPGDEKVHDKEETELRWSFLFNVCSKDLDFVAIWAHLSPCTCGKKSGKPHHEFWKVSADVIIHRSGGLFFLVPWQHQRVGPISTRLVLFSDLIWLMNYHPTYCAVWNTGR